MEDISKYLHDIHTPADVSFWPIAIGWWILVFVIALTVLALYWVILQIRKKETMQLARKELIKLYNDYRKKNNASEFVRNLSVLMRRYYLSHNAGQLRNKVAGLAGQDWLRYLDRGLKGKPFSQGVGKAMIIAPYQASSDVDVKQLYSLCLKRIDIGV